MFETTTNFDLDDDIDLQIDLQSSFTPSSTVVLPVQVKKRCVEDTKNKCLQELRPIKNPRLDNTGKCDSIQRNVIDTYKSPSRIVKRKFPGPAGLLPSTGASNKSILELLEDDKLDNNDTEDLSILSQQSNSVFKDGPWSEMSKDFHVSLIEQFNVTWIKQNALKFLASHKVPFLAAIVQNLDITVGKVPTVNVLLKDTTGTIHGTILHNLYEELSSYFRIGSVLVLKQFGVLSLGYNNHCVTITPNNVMSIYYTEAPSSLPRDGMQNILSTKENFSIKKVVIQSCNTEDILNKYDEDVKMYSQKKQQKVKLVPFLKKVPNITQTSVSSNSKDPVIHKFNFKQHSIVKDDKMSVECGPSKIVGINRNYNDNKACDNIVISSTKILVKPDNKDDVEIWKNLLEDVDTESLFEDF